MSTQNFIKSVWIANMLDRMKKAHVYAALANTNYQGSLHSLGDRVKIQMIGDVTINDYTRGKTLVLQEVQDAQSELIADQAHDFNFSLNDVDAVQEKTELIRGYTDSAAYGLRDKVDLYFAGQHAKAGYQNYATGTTPWDVTSANVEDAILSVKAQMGSNDIQTEGRFMIVPEWFHNKLILAGLASESDTNALWTNGQVARVFGFDIFLSNNVSHTVVATGDHAKIFAGIKGQSFSFAEVITEVEAYRPDQSFSDAVKGLYVYGGKIMRPDMTVVLHADETSG